MNTNPEDPQDEALAAFTDRILNEEQTDMAPTDTDPEMKRLQELALLLAERSQPSPAAEQRIRAALHAEWATLHPKPVVQAHPRLGERLRSLFSGGEQRTNGRMPWAFALAGAAVALLIAGVPALRSLGGGQISGAASTGVPVAAAVLGTGLVLVVIWLLLSRDR